MIRAKNDNIAQIKVEKNECVHSLMKKLGESKFSLDNCENDLLGE